MVNQESIPVAQVATQADLNRWLWSAVFNGRLHDVIAALDAGADPNDALVDTGITLIYVASQLGYTRIVTVLLNKGAIIDLATLDGGTALYIAIQCNQFDTVTTLIAAGANINHITNEGATPLLMAARQGHVNLVTAFLAAGANSLQTTIYGATPLYLAAFWGHFKIIQILVRHQELTMPHPPISINTQQGYLAFVKDLLSEETARDYYLNHIIRKPDDTRAAFVQNPIFFTELATHRNALWARLQDPSRFNLSTDQYNDLLRIILDSHQEPNEALRHPLYTLFNEPQPVVGSFFSSGTLRTTRTILDAIQDRLCADRLRSLVI